MIYFLVVFPWKIHRYVSDEEDNLENNSQLLLLRLQEQAKIRQLKKEEQNRYLSTRVTGPEPEILGADTLKDLKQKVKKKKVNQESPLTEGHGKESKKRYADLPENGDGSRRSKKHKGKSRIPEGKTEAAKRGENMLDTCLENSFIPAEEKVDGFTVSVKENEAGGEQKTLMQSSKMSPTSSMIVFSSCDQKIVQKVQPLLPQWFTQTKVFQRQIKENLIPLQDVPVIHPKLMKKLQANGIESLFPVQAEVIPAILESGANGMSAGKGGFLPSDICVSAPTGSGKTLAFVIPVVQVLMDRVICHVRALAVLPTKELAQQVTKVFNIYTDGTGLKVVQLTGQKSFAKEQESLVETTLMGFRSLADIVVATPGRLVDHLQQSPQFSLRELRFLIIDEADRMIDNMHQNWLQQLVEAVYRDKEGFGSNNRLFRRTELNPSVAARSCYPQLPLQKLLFSATLTQNPEKLQQLGLHQPRLFRPANPGRAEAQPCAKEKYILPEGLLQYYVPCHLSWKPLFLLHFLLREECPQVLCFTNSKEASHRLFLLIRAFGGVNVAEFSSRLSPSKRKLTLKEFEQGKIQLLISTDATARGIDFGGVKCVVSYDAPPFIRTYIHRVGRTARAGKAGQAFTMLLKQQQHRFLKMLKEAGLPELQQQVVKNVSLQPLLQQYEQALAELAHLVKEERAGKRC